MILLFKLSGTFLILKFLRLCILIYLCVCVSTHVFLCQNRTEHIVSVDNIITWSILDATACKQGTLLCSATPLCSRPWTPFPFFVPLTSHLLEEWPGSLNERNWMLFPVEPYKPWGRSAGHSHCLQHYLVSVMALTAPTGLLLRTPACGVPLQVSWSICQLLWQILRSLKGEKVCFVSEFQSPGFVAMDSIMRTSEWRRRLLTSPQPGTRERQ